MRAPLMGFLFVLSSCFNPDPSRIVISCDAQHACLNGQSCIGGRCLDGSPSDAAAASDQGSTDQGSIDMLAPSGCVQGQRFPLGAYAWACPGTFNQGQARSLCAAGFQVCTDGARVDLAAGNSLSGFFIADARGYYTGGSQMFAICGPEPAASNRVWFGAGGRVANVYTAQTACQKFTKLLDCQPRSGWDCFMGNNLDGTKNTNASDGVLCCR